MEDKVKEFTEDADKVREAYNEFKKKYPDAQGFITDDKGLFFSMDIDKL